MKSISDFRDTDIKTIFKTLILSAFILAFASLPARAGDLSVWTIRQRCQATGSLLVRICPTAVRIDAIGQDFSVIARAPQWKVFAFSTERKTYFSWPLKDYAGLRKDVLFGSWLQQREWTKFAKTRNKSTGLNVDLMREVFKKGVDYSNAERDAVIGTAANIACSKEALTVYAHTVKLPVLSNMPLEGTIPKSIFGLNPHAPYLSTNYARAEIAPSSLFTIPPGLKEVKDDTAVTGTSGDAGFSELLPSMEKGER